MKPVQDWQRDDVTGEFRAPVQRLLLVDSPTIPTSRIFRTASELAERSWMLRARTAQLLRGLFRDHPVFDLPVGRGGHDVFSRQFVFGLVRSAVDSLLRVRIPDA